MDRGVRHLRKSDPILKELIKGIKLREITRTRGYFEALVEAIVSQQLSVKAADTIFGRLAALSPGKKFPTPKQILAIPRARMRRAGLSRMKADFIKDLARKVLDRTVDLKKMETWSDEEVIEHLTRVKGIGQWTAEMFLMFSLGREDVFSYGDLGLRNAMQKMYGLRKHPSEAQAKKISDCWKPYRTLACRYLWASLADKKKAPLTKTPLRAKKRER